MLPRNVAEAGLHFCASAFGASPWGSMHVHAPTRLVPMPVGFYGVNVQRFSGREGRIFGAAGYAANNRVHWPKPDRGEPMVERGGYGRNSAQHLAAKARPWTGRVALRLLLAGRVGGVRPGQRNNLKRNGGAALAQHANIAGSLTRDINDVAGRGATVCYLHHH